jgi:UDP-N-acetylmuramate dehydrogenase
MTINTNISLKPYNTFGIDVQAKFFTDIKHVADIDAIRKQAIFNQPKLILSGGSNILFTKNFDGLVIKNSIKGIGIVKETDTEIYIKVNAGENWHEFVQICVENNWGGVENLSLIPGQVGTSPMQNIGAYGVEVKDVFHSLEAYNIKSGQIDTYLHAACEFGYRESIFKKTLKGQYIITSVIFKLSKNPTVNVSYGAIEQVLEERKITSPSIKDVSEAIVSIRESKLPNPKEIGNAGSFFKNPVIAKSHFETLQKDYPNIVSYPISDTTVKVPAGWLIDNAGWKGKTFDNYGVHKNQALVLVNYNDAQGKDIFNLAETIQADIFGKYEIDLDMEVNVL